MSHVFAVVAKSINTAVENNLNIIVCVKQVLDITKEIEIDTTRGRIIRRPQNSILNLYDLYAIEQALLLKERYKGWVILLSMGPLHAEAVIKEGLVMGADEGILLTDPLFAGADTYATAYTLATAITKKIKNYKIVLCGKQTSDGETGQVGVELAAILGINYITYARQILSLEDNSITAERVREYGFDIVRTNLPVLLTMEKYLRVRLPSIGGLLSAEKKKITILNAQDLQLPKDKIGEAGSLTHIKRIYTHSLQRNTQFITGNTPKEIAEKLLTIIKTKSD